MAKKSLGNEKQASLRQILLKYKHKKRVNALTQPFVNLKSNTMKNTLQRYALFLTLQAIQ